MISTELLKSKLEEAAKTYEIVNTPPINPYQVNYVEAEIDVLAQLITISERQEEDLKNGRL